MESSIDAKIDPELRKLLSQAGGSDANIAAVMHLRPPPNAAVYPPEQIQGTVRKLLSRVAEHVGTSEKASNIFRFLSSFVIVADVPFVEELLHQPEISAAVANNQPITAISLGTSAKNES